MGDVVSINRDVIDLMIASNFIPVIAPLGGTKMQHTLWNGCGRNGRNGMEGMEWKWINDNGFPWITTNEERNEWNWIPLSCFTGRSADLGGFFAL